MLQQEVQSSVYFSYEDLQLVQIYDHIGKATTSDQAGSAVEGNRKHIHTGTSILMARKVYLPGERLQ